MYAEVDGVIRGWVGKISKPIDRSYTSTTDGLVPVAIERSCHVGVMFCRDLNIIEIKYIYTLTGYTDSISI